MINFYKMHGIGNDYVYIDCFKEKIDSPAELAVKISDRHFGVGSDGLILIKPSDRADCFMEMYNADGSQGKMCGNGVRCVARFMFDHGYTKSTSITVDTLSGLKYLTINLHEGSVRDITVDMGVPVLIPSLIPVRSDNEEPMINTNVNIDGREFVLTCVSMGNPHAVMYVDDVDTANVEGDGRMVESAKIFPERVNTEFVQVLDRGNVRMRVWERGSGETLACGTGACAVAVAGVISGRTDRKVSVMLRGGNLAIEWRECDGRVYMTGTATSVFSGIYDENN